MSKIITFFKTILKYLLLYSLIIPILIYSFYNINLKSLEEYKKLKGEEICGIIDFEDYHLTDGSYKFNVHTDVVVLNKTYKVSWYDSFPYSITNDVLSRPQKVCTEKMYIIKKLKLENNKTLEEMVDDNAFYMSIFIVFTFITVIVTICGLVYREF